MENKKRRMLTMLDVWKTHFFDFFFFFFYMGAQPVMWWVTQFQQFFFKSRLHNVQNNVFKREHEKHHLNRTIGKQSWNWIILNSRGWSTVRG